MNYYRRYVGDYLRDTSRLSMLEHGAYTLLLDHYYSEGKALPAGLDALYRMCRAMTKVERAAVQTVVDQFFPAGEDGRLHNRRADEELAKAEVTIEKQRQSGVDSAAKRWSTDRSTHRSTARSAIQPPTTSLQEKEKSLKTVAASPPMDPVRSEIWITGKTILEGQGASRDDAGGFLGKLCKDYGQKLVLDAVRDCARTTPAEAKAWLVARCQERRAQSGNKQTALEARNAAAGAEWLEKYA